MPSDILLQTNITQDERSAAVGKLFDVQPDNEATTIIHGPDLPTETWQIGAIVGDSGTGKSTLLSHYTANATQTDPNNFSTYPITALFPAEMQPKEIALYLSSVGFSSPKAWLRPVFSLSNGERERLRIALALSTVPNRVGIDEFTSCLDRHAAKICAAAVATHIRRSNRQLIVATCHTDVLEWLAPDWVIKTPDGTLARGSLPQRPTEIFTIRRGNQKLWPLFRDHHYLTKNINPGARCIVATSGAEPVAIAAVIIHPLANGKSFWRESRLVCLPKWQGIGIGSALSDFVASMFAASGRRYRSTTAHPAMIAHRHRSKHWKQDYKPRANSKGSDGPYAKTRSINRVVTPFEWIGPPNHAAWAALNQKETM